MSLRTGPDEQTAEEDNGLFTNRSTMMANFEEWIKMATDNKINSRNSWNFALIDYFHDLQVLRDGENNINFQKASATLDGCVKIYSSRVDSVSTETGKLLSGLAQSKDIKHKAQNCNEENGTYNGDRDEVDIDPSTGLPVSKELEIQTRKRNSNRVLETTLVDFEQIKLKELDQELNIDPIFKKALVDFDEGGAKSFLLNTLSVDDSCRVVFDTTIREVRKECEQKIPNQDSEIEDFFDSNVMASEDEVLSLGMEFINFEQINNCEVSSSIQQLREVLEDIDRAKNFIRDVNDRFDNFLSEDELQEVVPDTNFDEGAQFDCTPLPLDGELMLEDKDGHGLQQPSLPVEADTCVDKFSEQDLIAYFDENLKRNWRGREHWKVRNIKGNLKGASKQQNKTVMERTNAVVPESTSNGFGVVEASVAKRKAFEIDFFHLDDNLYERIFNSKSNKRSIEMLHRLRTNSDHYLLPDDYHFSGDKITRLFIKPNQKMSLFRRKNASGSIREQEEKLPVVADEKFWAENYEKNEREKTPEGQFISDVDNPFEDYDDNVDFNQAFGGAEAPQPTPAVLPIKDSKVHYARVSKKVDVRKLKDNLWGALTLLRRENKLLSFTNIAREVAKNYTEETRRELSSSFCFICLLHLANEHGFQIENSSTYEDLFITWP